MDLRISNRDLETISAYLDGQISEYDRQQFDARLKAEENLSLAFDQMQRTRLVLRTTPKVRAPRNYTLTPKMVQIKPKERRSFPVFGLASAMASVLFVLVLLSDLLVAQSTPIVSVLQAQPVESFEDLQEAPEEPGLMAESQAPESQRKTQVGEGGAVTETPSGEVPALEMMQITPEPYPYPPGEISPLMEAEEADSAQEFPDGDESAQNPLYQISAARTILRVVEITLLMIAISSGIAAYIFYRRGHLL